MNPEVSVSLWNLYIQPRLLYGLESIQLSRADISTLKKYQRDFLRQIQHLPERVAACSVYILSGLLPIELEIHKSQLTLFGNVIRQDCVERDLAIRQLAVKDLNGFISSKIYDKRDDFDFDIVKFPFLDGDVPHRASYGVYISQLIRFVRVCNHVADFNERNKCLTAKLLQQGYRYINFEKPFLNFIADTMN